MKLVHTEMTKGQRALRAFLNTDQVPKGFKGNPAIIDDIKTEHSLSPANLSRYLCARGLLEMALLRLAHYETNSPRSFTIKGLREKASVTELWEMRKELDADKSWYNIPDCLLPNHRKFWFRYPGFLRVRQINKMLEMVCATLYSNIQEEAIRLIEPENNGRFIEDIRKHGIDFELYLILRDYAEMLGKSKEGLQDANSEAFDLLRFYLFMKASLSSTMDEDETDTAGQLGRVVFSEDENRIWRYAHKRLFEPRQNILEVLIDIEEEFDIELCRGIKRITLVNLHNLHRAKWDFEYNGNHFVAEASPFAEKPLGRPISDFDIVVYPADLEIKDALSVIGDPKFEHADGALAFASVKLDRVMLIEEMQTDAPDLLRRIRANGCVPEALDAVNNAEEMLMPLIETWPEILLAAVKEFAHKMQHSTLLGATPWRVVQRYEGGLHPDKVVRIYFDLMQKLGGQLVHAEKSLDDDPEYYWRFNV